MTLNRLFLSPTLLSNPTRALLPRVPNLPRNGRLYYKYYTPLVISKATKGKCNRSQVIFRILNFEQRTEMAKWKYKGMN